MIQERAEPLAGRGGLRGFARRQVAQRRHAHVEPVLPVLRGERGGLGAQVRAERVHGYRMGLRLGEHRIHRFRHRSQQQHPAGQPLFNLFPKPRGPWLRIDGCGQRGALDVDLPEDGVVPALVEAVAGFGPVEAEGDQSSLRVALRILDGRLVVGYGRVEGSQRLERLVGCALQREVQRGRRERVAVGVLQLRQPGVPDLIRHVQVSASQHVIERQDLQRREDARVRCQPLAQCVEVRSMIRR